MRGVFASAVFFAAAVCSAHDDSEIPRDSRPPGPERSAPILPPPRHVAVSLCGHGAYVPHIDNLSSGRTGAFGGSLTWTFAFAQEIGLFGMHSSTTYLWSDVGLLTFGHEVGLRVLPLPRTGIELAYLTHRADHQWIEDNRVALGGVMDRGVELAVGHELHPLGGLVIRARLLGRYFFGPRDHDGSRGYASHQLAGGAGIETAIRPLPGHELLLGAQALGVHRFEPREGVDQRTVNVLGLLRWRSHLSPRLGLEVGLRVSTNLLVGAQPMLELKRSMIGEPMAMGFAGMFAVI